MVDKIPTFQIVTLPIDNKAPKMLVLQAIDRTTKDVVGTLKAQVNVPRILNKKEINSGYLIPSEGSSSMAKSHIYVEDLYVPRAQRSKGIGTALMKNIVKKSKDSGFDGRIILLAGSNEDCPLPFYRKLGFTTNSGVLNRKLDDVVKFHTYIDKSIQSFMTISKKAAEKLIKSIR